MKPAEDRPCDKLFGLAFKWRSRRLARTASSSAASQPEEIARMSRKGGRRLESLNMGFAESNENADVDLAVASRLLSPVCQSHLPAEQHQRLVNHMGAEMGGHAVDVLRWAHRIDIDGHDVEVGEAAQEVDALARRQATP